ncbi:MAG: YihY/virulence factor BrkB family protein [Eubacteriales bacterium]
MKIKDVLKKIADNKVIKSVFYVIGKVVNTINRHRIYNKGAELAYYMVIGLLTIIATVVYAAHFIPNLIQTVNQQFLVLLPENVSELILNAMLEIKMPKSITVIVATSITSIWFVSRAMHSIMISFNEIYGVKGNHIGFKSKAFSILFTLALIAMFLILFAMTIVQGALSGFIEKYFNTSMSIFKNNEFWETLISAGILLFIFNSLYYYLPNKKLRWYYSVPGAVFSTFMWILMSKGFTLFINSISSFSWILGSFGSLFVFLIWIYYSALFLLIGAVINSIIMRRVEAKKALDEAKEA